MKLYSACWHCLLYHDQLMTATKGSMKQSQLLGTSQNNTVIYASGWALCGHETPAGEAEQEGAAQSTPSSVSDGPSVDCASKGHTLQSSDAAAAVAPNFSRHCEHGRTNDAASSDEHMQPPQQDPVMFLSRAERMALGQNCKRLIDAGRQEWLAEQGFQASSLANISSTC